MTHVHGVGGDLSRRVARRRAELGLSLEDVGQEAGIDPGYLNYLENHADAHLSAGSLILLAMALKTSPELLLGGHPPLGREGGGSNRHPQVEPLTPEQCEVHLALGEYGRLVYSVARGPVAIPVITNTPTARSSSVPMPRRPTGSRVCRSSASRWIGWWKA